MARFSFPTSGETFQLMLRDDNEPGSRPGKQNIFVRMPPHVVQDLHSQALKDFGDRDSAFDDPAASWIVQLHSRESGRFDEKPINFLPLEISLRDDDGEIETIYASFNGGTLRCADNHRTIEIARSLLPPSCSGRVHKLVSVRALKRIEYATRVEMEPLSVEDWELLEIHSHVMEQGGLLKQVSVLYQGQLLTLCVGGRGDEVKMLVKDVAGGLSRSGSFIWPNFVDQTFSVTGYKSSTAPPEQTLYALLVQGTEVVVVPKPRPPKQNMSWTPSLRLIPSERDWGDASDLLARLTGIKATRVAPWSVVVHGDQWKYESEWARIKPANSKGPVGIVKVITSPDVAFQSAVLHYESRRDMKLDYFFDSVRLKPLSPKLICPDFVSLKRVECTTRSCDKTTPSWTVPDIALASVSGNDGQTEVKAMKLTIPVGALVAFVADPNIDDCECLYRLIPKNDNEELKGNLLRVDLDGLQDIWTGQLQNAMPTIESIQLIRDKEIRGPRNHTGSTDWLIPLVHMMDIFGSAWVNLFGTTGCGKSHCATLLGSFASFSLHRPLLYLNCKKLQKSSPKMTGILAEVDVLFRRAQETIDAIIILDDLDAMCPNLARDVESNVSAKMHTANSAAIDQSKLLADRLCAVFNAASKHCGVTVVCTSSTLDSVNPAFVELLRVPIIQTQVPMLSSIEQINLLTETIQRQCVEPYVKLDFADLSQRMSGFISRDLEKLAFRVSRSFQSRFRTQPIGKITAELLETFTPLAQMEAANRRERTGTTRWEYIGGMFEAKMKLDTTVRHPMMYHRIYEKAGVSLPRGILLYGPPGCGKSFVVPALAQACNYPLVLVRGPEIFDKYIGASEAKIREVFGRATQMAPSILFLDELEALAPRRGSDSTGVTDRVVNQLLTFLDGVEDATPGTVYVVGATSRPDKVDPAILRPGRLERHIFIGPPENDVEWKDLLIRISKQRNLTQPCKSGLANGIFVGLASAIPHLSPADIGAVFDTAHLSAVHRKLASTSARDIESVDIDFEDLKLAFQDTRPSLNETEARALDALYKPFRETSKGDVIDKDAREDKGLPLKTTFK